MLPKPKVAKSVFKFLTGVVVGSAVGSILGLTLAPKKGTETRQLIKDKSLDLFLKGKEAIANDRKPGFLKRFLKKWSDKG